MISFVVAVYNAADTLAQCLDSVIAQNCQDFELLVIDGGSSDGSLDVLHERASQIAYWTSDADQGVYDAWNKALPHVRGEWVSFLGADDYLWSNDVVGALIEQLKNLSAHVCIAYGQIVLLDKGGNPMFALGDPWESVESQFIKQMCLPHPAVMHRRSVFETYGEFDTSFRIAGDYEFLLRTITANRPHYLGELLVTAMRPGGLSTNPANTIMGLREAHRALAKHGYPVAWLSQCMAWARVYLRLLANRWLGPRLTPTVLDWGRRLRGLPPYWTKV